MNLLKSLDLQNFYTEVRRGPKDHLVYSSFTDQETEAQNGSVS